MAVIAVNVTEFARGLSEFLNQVQYKGQTLNIARGKRVIAQVSPASLIDGFPIVQLDELLGTSSQLTSTERQAMAQDVRELRVNLKSTRNPWAS
jgi:antitoxin (DNA-binding transcriptional repressor) of toxin-antitoxin stability system